MRRAWLGVLALAACGDPEPTAPPPKPAATAAKGAATPPTIGQAATPIDPAKAALLAELRKRPFKNADFVESEGNRDPFRSFLADFSGGQSITTQYKILLPKYSLDELKLIAIVGPPTRGEGGGHYTQTRAMFLDPQGMGVSIVRGDHISKADAKVVRIETEKGKVYVELKEDAGGGKTRQVERALELHQSDSLEGANP
jgi:type IV pilus assembly protein PilP